MPSSRTTKQLAEVVAASTPEALLPEVHGFRLTCKCLQALWSHTADQQAWLDDEHIDMIARSISSGSTKKVMVLDTQFVAWWTEWTLDKDCARGAPGTGENLTSQLADREILWIPCHTAGNHWTCMFVFLHERQFEFFDPLGRPPGILDAVCRHIIHSISRYGDFIDTSSWPCMQVTTTQVQQDSYNCGLWILGALDVVSEGVTTSSFVEIPSFAITWLRQKYFLMLSLLSFTDKKASEKGVPVEEPASSTENVEHELSGRNVERDILGEKNQDSLADLRSEVEKILRRQETALRAEARWKSHSAPQITNNIDNLIINLPSGSPVDLAHAEQVGRRILDVLFRQVGGATFVPPSDSMVARRIAAGVPRVVNTSAHIEFLEQREQDQVKQREQDQVTQRETDAQKKRVQFAEEGDVELLLSQLAAKSPDVFCYNRGERMTKQVLAKHLELQGDRVSLAMSRSALLERIRALKANRPGTLSPTTTPAASISHSSSSMAASSAASPAPDPTGASTPQNEVISADDEALIIKALAAKAASCTEFGFTHSRKKVTRRDLLQYLKVEGLRVPWHDPRENLMRIVLGHIRSTSSASALPPMSS